MSSVNRAATSILTSPSATKERCWIGFHHKRPCLCGSLPLRLSLRIHGWGQQNIRLGHTQPVSATDPPEFAYASLLRSYASSSRIVDGMCLHAHIIRRNLESNALLGNLLVQMYGQYGALDEASAVFASLDRDHFAWNFLIRSHATRCQLAESLLLFHRMLSEAILPDRFIMVGILSACTSSDHISVGKSFHSYVTGSSSETDTVIGTAFLNMYGKCGSFEDAQRCFDKLVEEDVVSFNAMIAAVQRAGYDKSALQFFNQMQQQSVLPERVTFLNTLSACAKEELLAEGKRLHSYSSCTNFGIDLSIETALVNMYGKCHSVEDAQRTFDMMVQHDVVSWNALIAVYAQHKHIKEALYMFEEMQREGVMPDPITFICLLDACGNQGVVLDKDWIQVNIKGTEAGFDMEVGISLMTMYSNCGNIEGAWETFNTIPNRSITFWNTLLSVLVKHRKLEEAFQLTADIFQHDVVPNKFTYIALLDVCVSMKALVEGNLLHMCMVQRLFELDAVASTSIINMYSKCGRPDEASKVFQTIPDRQVASWNAFIPGHAENADDQEVICLSQQMLQEGILPNDITILCMLNACFSEEALGQGKRIHSCILGTEHESNTVLETALVNMYGKCGSTSSAQRVFSNLPERDTVAWSAMMSSFAQGAEIEKAYALSIQMLEEGALPDLVTYVAILCVFQGQAALSRGKKVHACIVAAACEMEGAIETALISMYCRCGSLDEALALLSERLDRSVAAWNALIGGFAQSGHGVRTFQLYEQMQQEGVLPDNQTFIGILTACSSATTLAKGHHIHTSVVSCNLASDTTMEVALVNMYGECGSLKDAQMVFLSMHSRNIVSWTAIIAVNAQHGHGKTALCLFKQMIDEGHVPNRAILVSIFSACSHTGLIDDLKESLGFVCLKVGVSVGVDLYNCLIDLFSRAGRLEEAEALIGSMPQGPTVVSWTTLLGGCKNQVDVERGERAALQILRLDSENAEPYVALANIYAAAGMEENAHIVFQKMSGQAEVRRWVVDGVEVPVALQTA